MSTDAIIVELVATPVWERVERGPRESAGRAQGKSRRAQGTRGRKLSR